MFARESESRSPFLTAKHKHTHTHTQEHHITASMHQSARLVLPEVILEVARRSTSGRCRPPPGGGRRRRRRRSRRARDSGRPCLGAAAAHPARVTRRPSELWRRRARLSPPNTPRAPQRWLGMDDKDGDRTKAPPAREPPAPVTALVALPASPARQAGRAAGGRRGHAERGWRRRRPTRLLHDPAVLLEHRVHRLDEQPGCRRQHDLARRVLGHERREGEHEPRHGRSAKGK